MKDIAIYGAGGFGQEIACLLNMINKKELTWNLIGFFDDGKEKGEIVRYGKILGGINELNSWREPLSVVIAIGKPQTIFSIVQKISSPFIDFPNIIAPDVSFLDRSTVVMGKGNILGLGCGISCNVIIGNFNVLNGPVGIGHDVSIGSYNSFMPNTRISGEVKVGNRNFMGVSSAILQGIRVTDDIVLGAGSVLIRKVKAGMTYVGNPAVIVKF